jgi:hypothetical protein
MRMMRLLREVLDGCTHSNSVKNYTENKMTRMTPFFNDIRYKWSMSLGPNYELGNCIWISWIIITQDLWFQAPSQEMRIATRVDMTVTRETKYSYWTRTKYCCIMRTIWKEKYKPPSQYLLTSEICSVNSDRDDSTTQTRTKPCWQQNTPLAKSS